MYDVIVIGGGPGGSAAAKTVASAGYNVLIIEKNASCRSPCAGYISKTINIEIPERHVIQSNIKRMRTYFPDMSYHDFSLDGYVVDRSLFDMSLLTKAAESGAKVIWNSPVIDITEYNVRFRNGIESARIIIGADGVFSKTASIMGLDRQRFAACSQYHIKGIKLMPQTCEIFFDAHYAPGGYVWIYPTGKDSAKVGLGMINSNKFPHENLDAFLIDSRIGHRIYGEKTGYIAGALPVGGLREKLVFNNILLTGDSAGMADPVTGAGIINAILAGGLAGKTIIKALQENNMHLLMEYEIKIRRLLGRSIDRSSAKRKKLNACHNNRLLQEHLPELWVTFKEYWQ